MVLSNNSKATKKNKNDKGNDICAKETSWLYERGAF